MEINFCRRCGHPLYADGLNSFSCQNNHTLYRNPLPTVGIFILNGNGQVFLAKRAIEPRQGEFDTIGGFVDGEESFEQTATREIREETGLTPDQFSEFTYLCSAIGNYPYQDETLLVLTVFYTITLVDQNTLLTPHDDVAEIVTCDVHALNTLPCTAPDVRAAMHTLQLQYKN